MAVVARRSQKLIVGSQMSWILPIPYGGKLWQVFNWPGKSFKFKTRHIELNTYAHVMLTIKIAKFNKFHQD